MTFTEFIQSLTLAREQTILTWHHADEEPPAKVAYVGNSKGLYLLHWYQPFEGHTVSKALWYSPRIYETRSGWYYVSPSHPPRKVVGQIIAWAHWPECPIVEPRKVLIQEDDE